MLEALDQIMLEDQLAHHTVKIEFTKVDGSTRVMICTKNPDIITQDNMPAFRALTESEVSSENPKVLRVFDMEKQGWRSMRIANITSWQLEQ